MLLSNAATQTLRKEDIEVLSNDFVEKVRHYTKIDVLTNRQPPLTIPIQVVEELIGNNFRWFIKADFISKFNYHAIFSVSEERDDEHRNSPLYIFDTDAHSGEEPFYIGDVPEFALDKALKVKEVGINYLTIHSNQYLPVSSRKDKLSRVDPILIGWYTNPRIDIRDRKLHSIAVSMGVVVAIWDMDKELDVL